MTTPPQPLWIKAVVTREGPDLVTRCCVVVGANFHPIEVRVNLPKLAATLRAMGMGPKGDSVAGFGSFLKKAAKAITNNKVTRAVGKVVSKVAKSPIVQIANPMMAIGIHTLSRAAGGKGTIRGRAGAIVDAGTAVALPAGVAYASSRAQAALGIGLKAVMSAKTAGTVANVARQAQQVVAQGKNAAALLNAGKLSASIAGPLVKQAAAIRANVQKLAPALAKKVAVSKRVQSSIKNIAVQARAGSSEARLASASIVAAARMTDKIAAAQQAARGGHSGFVITPEGKIRKAPKGKFVQSRSLPVLETLYRGARVEPLKGAFTAVSGSRKHRSTERQTLVPREYPALEAEVYRALVEDAYQRETLPAPAPRGRVGGMHETGPSWGGYDDPADQYEGPLYPVQYPGEDDFVGGYPVYRSGVRHWALGSDLKPKAQGVRHWALGSDLKPKAQGLDSVGGRPLPAGSRSWPRPAAGTTAAARERAAAFLELARARHHASQVLKRARDGAPRAFRGDGVFSTTTQTKVGHMPYNLVGNLGLDTSDDVPPEMAAYNDGLTSVELIGCAMGPEVSGFPSYLFTRKGLHPTVVRRRFLAALKAMPPKLRRRVLTRLKRATLRTRISGAIQSMQPSFGGYGDGWAAVSGSGCSQVAGALTP